MNFEEAKFHHLRRKGVSEETPFDADTMVYKVLGKMFSMVAWTEIPLRITLKCDPDDSLAYQAAYKAVTPGYYMNKKHWITVLCDGSIADEEIYAWIDQSYDLVVQGLSRTERQRLAEMEPGE